MKQAWIDFAMSLAYRTADFYSGARKIHRFVSVGFKPEDWAQNDLRLNDAGYTKSKLSYLTRAYLHEESRDVAVMLWKRRCEQAKYGSVGFTCYNHFIKNDPNKKSKRASVMGPCIQSVNLTWLKKDELGIDVFYRTTEVFKKFPADLYFLRNVLLEPFQLNDRRVVLNMHFANVTSHPMYFVTLIPHFDHPLLVFDGLRNRDRFFHDWTVKWTTRYVCPEYHRGIAKFAQALRVQKDALARISPSHLRKLRQYLITHHPGHRNDYDGDDDDEV